MQFHDGLLELTLSQDVVFYQLPLHAHYYSELVNAIGGDGAAVHATVTTLFSAEDAGARPFAESCTANRSCTF